MGGFYGKGGEEDFVGVASCRDYRGWKPLSQSNQLICSVAWPKAPKAVFHELIIKCLTMKVELMGQMPENSLVSLMAAGASSLGIRA
jgi:hypothetical protein